MLDLRFPVSGTPGVATAILQLNTAIPTDGSVVNGVPLRPDARLLMHGSISLLANTIGRHVMIAQDCIDPINGENIWVGAASLKNLYRKFCNIPYGTGARTFWQGTNTAQTATSMGFSLDYYEPTGKVGDCVKGDRFIMDTVMVPQLLTVDTALAWVNDPYAPATPIPNGKYALLGFWLANATQPHGIRFSHADFGFCLPGVPVMDTGITSQTKEVSDCIQNNPGYQFVALSEITGKPCVPTFRVSNAATGLTIQHIAAAAVDTAYVTPYLAKIGS